MQYYNENYDVEAAKGKKWSTLVLVLIVLTVIAIIAVTCTILYIQQRAFRVYINGASVNLPKDVLIMNENSDKVYIDIKGIAKYLGYDAHNGEYKLSTEDTNKCWVNGEYETASFFLNSNKISKVKVNSADDYEDYTITDPVVNRNGKLYCTQEGIKIGFNVTFNYNKQANRIEIYTLPHLVETYTAQFKTYGYDGLSRSFNNQKAILYNMFVVKKDNNQYGVVTSTNEELISPRYSDMEFNESAGEFYVKNSSGKVGIITEDGITKINLIYDQINMIDKNLGLYAVRNNNKYGVIGNTGNIVIHLEYDQVGVTSSQFVNNGISNKYLLFENAIPVCQNKKWGMFDINGNMIMPLEWDTMGYSAGSSGSLQNRNVNNTLIIPSYKAIVVGQEREIDKKKVMQYAIYDYKGEEIIPWALTNVYFITNAGVNTYYMEYQGHTLNVEKYIEDQYEREGKNKPTDTINNNSTNSSVTNTLNS